MKARLFAALLGALVLCVSFSSEAGDGQGEGGNGGGQGGGQGGNQGGNSQGTVPAPEFEGQTAGLGVALALGAAAVVAGRSRRLRR